VNCEIRCELTFENLSAVSSQICDVQMLQHTATLWIRTPTSASLCSICTTLQHAAIHCNTLQYTVALLQHTETHCNTTATHCNTLDMHTTSPNLQHTATPCNTLQHTGYAHAPFHHFAQSAKPCSKLRHPATLLRHTATHCNTLYTHTHHFAQSAPHCKTLH